MPKGVTNLHDEQRSIVADWSKFKNKNRTKKPPLDLHCTPCHPCPDTAETVRDCNAPPLGDQHRAHTLEQNTQPNGLQLLRLVPGALHCTTHREYGHTVQLEIASIRAKSVVLVIVLIFRSDVCVERLALGVTLRTQTGKGLRVLPVDSVYSASVDARNV